MERYVELRRPAGLMRGMLHLPDRKSCRPPWPGVALFHGFTGGRTEARFQWNRALTFKPDAELIPAIERKLRDGL